MPFDAAPKMPENTSQENKEAELFPRKARVYFPERNGSIGEKPVEVAGESRPDFDIYGNVILRFKVIKNEEPYGDTLVANLTADKGWVSERPAY